MPAVHLGFDWHAHVWQVEPFEVVCCDLGLCMRDRLRRQVDILVFNPPYVPTPPEEVGSK